MIELPTTVEFDLSDAQFLLQLAHLASLFPQLFQEFSDVLPHYAAMHWDDFAAITTPEFFEASFDGSYLVLRLHFLDGELHIVAHLSGGIVKLVSIIQPIVHA
ncbi:hypothetical protein [Massilia sp. TWR1-2-2]|uniref:hypothetical protein n=1 Tax=Massilia sp. TWR1-2-2 TaxID=2804584 RepID=UPI003CE6D9DB